MIESLSLNQIWLPIEILILYIYNEKLSSLSNQLGYLSSDMSLGRSNMKLKIMGVFNIAMVIGLWLLGSIVFC